LYFLIDVQLASMIYSY